MRHDGQRRQRHAHNGIKVAQRIEGHILVKTRIDRLINPRHQQRVTVRHGFRDGGSADDTARATLVFNHHTLPPGFGQTRSQMARHDIGGGAGGKRHDHPHRPLRKALRGDHRGPQCRG